MSNDDILKNLELLAPLQAKSIEKFLKSPNTASYQGVRNGLLRSQTDLDIAFICWQLAFNQAGYQDHSAESLDFEKRAASKRKRHDEYIRCVLTLSEKWGKERSEYYNWQSKGENYLNKLRIVALKVPEWSQAVTLFNQSIAERITRRDKRTPIVQKSANSIENWDLEHVKEALRQSKPVNIINSRQDHIAPPPDGYSLDRYGLIIRAPSALSPSSPSSGHTISGSYRSNGCLVLSTPSPESTSRSAALPNGSASISNSTTNGRTGPPLPSPLPLQSPSLQGKKTNRDAAATRLRARK